jgi:hypothetical protein
MFRPAVDKLGSAVQSSAPRAASLLDHPAAAAADWRGIGYYQAMPMPPLCHRRSLNLVKSLRRSAHAIALALLLQLAAALAFSSPARAEQEQPAGTAGAGNVASSPGAPAADPEAAEFLSLVETYRGGYYSLAWAAIFSVYAQASAIAGDFSSGGISAEDAQDRILAPGQLLSVLHASLQPLRGLTPDDDAASHGELSQLSALVGAEDALLAAMLDWAAQPGAASEQTALDAKDKLEALFEASSQ